MRSFNTWTVATKQTLVRLVLTHVCHKFLCTTTAPKVLLLSFCFHITLLGQAELLALQLLEVSTLLFIQLKSGKLLESFPAGSLFRYFFGRESSDWRKPVLNHSWQWGNQLYWRLLFFKGPRPFLAACHFRSLWCHPSGGFQVSLLNP